MTTAMAPVISSVPAHFSQAQGTRWRLDKNQHSTNFLRNPCAGNSSRHVQVHENFRPENIIFHGINSRYSCEHIGTIIHAQSPPRMPALAALEHINNIAVDLIFSPPCPALPAPKIGSGAQGGLNGEITTKRDSGGNRKVDDSAGEGQGLTDGAGFGSILHSCQKCTQARREPGMLTRTIFENRRAPSDE